MSCRCVSLLLLLSVASAARGAESNIASSLIPFDALSVTNRLLVRGVTNHYTLRRQYKARQFHARKEDFEYLMDHMEVCSVLAQKVGLIKYRATLDARGRLFADDRDGASGYLLRVFAGDGKRVFYAEGSQRGLFEVYGRGAVVVDYAQPKPDVIEYKGALFVKVDNVVVAALTQLFSVFLRGTVDQHFDHVLRQPIMLSESALREQEKLLDQVSQLPESDRELLAVFAQQLRSAVDSSGNR